MVELANKVAGGRLSMNVVVKTKRVTGCASSAVSEQTIRRGNR